MFPAPQSFRVGRCALALNFRTLNLLTEQDLELHQREFGTPRRVANFPC
jgi:hypothetical protein